MLDDGFAKSNTLFGIFDRFINSPLGNANSQRGNHGARQVQRLHGVDEALPFLANEMICRNVDVLEDDFRRIGQADAHLIFFFADGNARAVAFDDEGRNTFNAFRLVGDGKYCIDRSDTAISDEAFRAVQYVFIPLFDSDCRPSCRIGTGIGFSQAESAETAALFTG